MINKILTPTDFSATAKAGVIYAIEFARRCHADLVLLHVLPSLGQPLAAAGLTRIMENVIEQTENKFKKLVRGLNAGGISLNYHITFGAGVGNAVEGFAEMHGIDLIIMSSKGASGLTRVLLGSNAVSVINKSTVPVLLVPEHAPVSIPRELIYASDLTNLDNEVHLLLPFAQALNAAVKIVHVIAKDEAPRVGPEKMIKSLIRETGFQKIRSRLIKSDDIATTIRKQILKKTRELLVVFTHNTSFFEQLFNKSIAREIAWSNQVPMLVFNNRE